MVGVDDEQSIDIVAEGVETVAQRDFLERFGSLEIQGWLFSKALPHDLAKAWIERHERASALIALPISADQVATSPIARQAAFP